MSESQSDLLVTEEIAEPKPLSIEELERVGMTRKTLSPMMTGDACGPG
jgi:hypothetical protein